MQKKDKETGWPDVAIHFIDAFYNLANSGNFLGILALFPVLLSFLIVWQLPPEALGNHVGTVLRILESGKYTLSFLGGTLIVSIIGNFVQRRIYKAEIRRLTHQRKKLIHGLENSSLNALNSHNPSDFDIDNGE